MLTYIQKWIWSIWNGFHHVSEPHKFHVFTGAQLYNLFGINFGEDNMERSYCLGDEEILGMIKGIESDPKTEPLRHRLKVRFAQVMENVTVLDTSNDPGEALLHDLQSLLNNCTDDVVHNAIEGIGDNEHMRDVFATFLGEYCLHHGLRCLVGVSPETHMISSIVLAKDDVERELETTDIMDIMTIVEEGSQ